MKLWTVQPIEVLKELEKKKKFVCDPQQSEFIENYKYFKDAYLWLVKEMEKRIGSRPEGVSFPIWAWYKRDWKQEKPNFKDDEYYHSNVHKFVCIELEIPKKRVVLSDFGTWHFVLNNSYLDMSKTEKGYERAHKRFDNLPNKEKQKVREKSWERIFNITPFSNDWVEIGRDVQATFWELYLNDVVNVEPI